MKVVIDANVFASALMNPSGTPAQVVHLIASQEVYDLVTTDEIMEELKRILFYPKIRKRIHGTDEDLNFWIEALIVISHHCQPRYRYEELVQEDPDDDKYLIAALESHSSYLISGDRHLLEMKQYHDIKIVTPAQFLSKSPC